MSRFHKLTNNKSDFPHISNVDVYKFDNDFDYSRYDDVQMSLQLCTVPWDEGEAHVGQRTMSGIGNVVYFETKEARDEWFDSIPDSECYRFETKFKELHRDHTIDVPIPYDVAAKFNYLAVKYNLFANDSSPVQYEDLDGLRNWFWFVREVEFIAPNSTRLHLMDDVFQTWIYDIDITNMILDRGHAPMFEVDVDDYLSNPLENSSYLLTDDVDFGDASIVRHTDDLVLNATNMVACIATSGDPLSDWGSKSDGTWKTPANTHYMNNGVPSVYVMALDPSQLTDFLVRVTASYPQFKQTVQGIFFASTELITLAESFTFAGTTCYRVVSSRTTKDLTSLDKSMFGYPEEYAGIAKLYTWPYAHLEVTDENGNVDVIKIEETTGNIDVSLSLSIAYPFINIEGHLIGTGGAGRRTITFRNVEERTFDIGGSWYNTLHEWKVPTFAVVLSANHEFDYATHFDRVQAAIAYDNAYTSATDTASINKIVAYNNADVAKANAYDLSGATYDNTLASADTMKGNADRSADTLRNNTDLQIAGNTSILAISNIAALEDARLQGQLQQALQAWEAGYSRATVNNQVDAQYASAAIGAAGGAISGAASGAMAMAPAGPPGMIVGAISGLLTSAISGATTFAQTAVSANLSSTQAEAGIALAQQKVVETRQSNTDRTNNQNSTNTANKDVTNNVNSATANNSIAAEKDNAYWLQTTMRANAHRDKVAADSVANRNETNSKANADNFQNLANSNATRSKTVAMSAVENAIKQAMLRAPFIYGAFADGDSAVTKPMALFANVVTESDAAIAAAGDEFLRYGYTFGRQWRFNGNWNVGRYFTYWKLNDFWVKSLSVPDYYLDKLRFFLFGGITVWRRPEYIGDKTIYDNF